MLALLASCSLSPLCVCKGRCDSHMHDMAGITLQSACSLPPFCAGAGRRVNQKHNVTGIKETDIDKQNQGAVEKSHSSC